MKKTLVLIFTISVLFGCSNKKAEKSTIMNDVMKVHEKVMEVDGQVIANRMKLDTIIKKGALAATDSAVVLNNKLSTAEDAMENWMHKFDYEQKGKSDDDIIKYMNDQKKLILAIDSQLNVAVTESNAYLKKNKAK
jgi:PBP1b-binding outer membrane lipoprotein LpoB